jgi:hypothetical protein
MAKTRAKLRNYLYPIPAVPVSCTNRGKVGRVHAVPACIRTRTANRICKIGREIAFFIPLIIPVRSVVRIVSSFTMKTAINVATTGSAAHAMKAPLRPKALTKAAPKSGPDTVPIAIVVCNKPIAKPSSSLGVVLATSMVAAGIYPESAPIKALSQKMCKWFVAKPIRAYPITRTEPARTSIGRLPYLSANEPHKGAIIAEARAPTAKTTPDQNETLAAVSSSERRIGKNDTMIMSPAWIRAQPIHKAIRLRRYFKLTFLQPYKACLLQPV